MFSCEFTRLSIATLLHNIFERMLQFVFFTSAKLLADTLKRRCTKYLEYRMSDLPKCWNKIRIGRRFVTPQFQDPNYNGIQFFSIDSDTYGCSCSLCVFCCIFLL